MDITVLKNIAYGNHERNVLDLYIPQQPKTESGLILYIHGGGWTSGDKKAHTEDVEYWSEKGYICATMNYRYVDEQINIFDELDDVTSALVKIKSVCAEKGLMLTKLLLSGGSAGANLSLLYAYSRVEESPLLPVAVCCHCPPTHCYRDDFLLGINGEFEDWKYSVLSHCCGIKIIKDTFKNEAEQGKLAGISPISYVNCNVVPTAIRHGVKDELVPYEHTLVFLDELEKNGVRHDLLTYPNSGHALDKDPDLDSEAKALIEQYIQDYLIGSAE